MLWVSVMYTALILRLVGLMPHSSVSLLLGFSAILSVSLVSRLTARSLHDYVLGCQTPSGERSWISRLQHGPQLIMARYTRIINCRPCCNLHITHCCSIVLPGWCVSGSGGEFLVTVFCMFSWWVTLVISKRATCLCIHLMYYMWAPYSSVIRHAARSLVHLNEEFT